jgi:hypothetical protein
MKFKYENEVQKCGVVKLLEITIDNFENGCKPPMPFSHGFNVLQHLGFTNSYVLCHEEFEIVRNKTNFITIIK